MHKFLFVVLFASVLFWNRAAAQKTDAAQKANTFQNLQRDTTYRPNVVEETEQARIELSDLTSLSVCPGVSISIDFWAKGSFEEGNVFFVQRANAGGKFSNIDTVSQSPARIKIPSDWVGSMLIRIVASKPNVVSNVSRVPVQPLPQAQISLLDGGNIIKIGPGQAAAYRVQLSGAAPWSFRLSDGTVVANTMVNPYIGSISPKETATIRVLSVHNSCGNGTSTGDLTVQVSKDTLPSIALKAIPKAGFRVCAGTPFQINFNAVGKYNIGNGFVVQLSDSQGEKFSNISDLIQQSPIMAKVSNNLPPGNYKLRVVSTFPTLSSDTVDVAVMAPARATLRPDTLEIPENGSTQLSVSFTGGGPWFVLLSDGTYQNDIRESPYPLRVAPYNTTAYKITSAGGYCGVGEFGGAALVKVKIPPSTITTESPAEEVVCAGTEITVPFKTTGRYENANKYIVQILDTDGRWVNLPTIGGTTSLRAKITPPRLTDTLTTQKIRVVSTLPVVEGTPTTIKVMMNNAAKATISGGGLVRPGGAARIKILFQNGLPPWSFTLSDGMAVSGTFINPYQLTVNPRTTTEYKLTSLKNGCGQGSSDGSTALVRVEDN